MINTSCFVIPKKRPVTDPFKPPIVLYDSCPERKDSNCSPVYTTERPRPGSPGEIDFLCFNGQFTAQPIPPNAECWCGNGFRGNTAYYWIWEHCMASTCDYCPPNEFRGGYWRYPNCCVLPFNSGYGQDLNCDGTGGLHTGYDKLCCSPVCQNIHGKTTQTLNKYYMQECDVYNYINAGSIVDTSNARSCNQPCCSNAKKITYEADVYFSGAIEGPALSCEDTTGNILLGSIINSNDGSPVPIYIENLGPIKKCQDSINKIDKLSVSINISERDGKCASDAITQMFLDNAGYLPPIKGCKTELFFNFQEDTNSRLLVLLDTESTNELPAIFDYNNNNDVTTNFKLAENNTYDKNYPDITLGAYRATFNTLSFISANCIDPRYVFSDKNNLLHIKNINVTYSFYIKNDELYMGASLFFEIPNDLGKTATVFNGEEILISQISDFYKEIVFLPFNPNNTNCTAKVSLYGR